MPNIWCFNSGKVQTNQTNQSNINYNLSMDKLYKLSIIELLISLKIPLIKIKNLNDIWHHMSLVNMRLNVSFLYMLYFINPVFDIKDIIYNWNNDIKIWN